MVLIKCRRHYGKKFTVYSKGKSRTVYDGSRYEYNAKDHGLSSKSINDVNLLTCSERTNLTGGPSFHTEDSILEIHKMSTVSRKRTCDPNTVMCKKEPSSPIKQPKRDAKGNASTRTDRKKNSEKSIMKTANVKSEVTSSLVVQQSERNRSYKECKPLEKKEAEKSEQEKAGTISNMDKDTLNSKKSITRWSNSAVEKLLQLMNDRKSYFAECQNITLFFEDITSELNKSGFDYDCDRCYKKWETLVKSYKKSLDHNAQPNSKQKPLVYQDSIKSLVAIRDLSSHDQKSKVARPKKKKNSKYFMAEGDTSDVKQEKHDGEGKVFDDISEKRSNRTCSEESGDGKSTKKSFIEKEIKQEDSGSEMTEKGDNKTDDLPHHKNSQFSKFLGAHVAISGGLHNAVHEAMEIGASSFALFLKSQRKWSCKPLSDADALKFRKTCEEYGYTPDLILPHGSYLMNCGSAKKETQEKSREALLDELERCERLGLKLFNFHPGSTLGEMSVEKCMDLVAECINYAHSKTKYCIAVIENMSCQGNTIGGRFEELRGIIDRVKDKSRIGVCLDTCHAFAAGYNLHSQEGYKEMMNDFERIIGFRYLKAVHLNDSIGEVGCHMDRHENIGKGKIGKKGFKLLMNDPRFNNIPMILETPGNYGYDRGIELLYSLCDEKTDIKQFT